MLDIIARIIQWDLTYRTIIWNIPIILGDFFVLRKAGEQGFKALIPFYGDYVKTNLIWDKKAYIMLIVTSLGGALLSAAWPEQTAVVWISTALSVFYLFFRLAYQIKLAFAFGKGMLFALGLFIAEPIFGLILGLDRSAYLGKDRI